MGHSHTPCLTKIALTCLGNSSHIPDQALNGFLKLLKVTHCERRSIYCRESILQVLKVTHWEAPEKCCALAVCWDRCAASQSECGEVPAQPSRDSALTQTSVWGSR